MNWNNRTLKTSELRIQITNSHIHARGVWVMHVREFGWNTRVIGVPDDATEKDAQIAAVENVRAHLKKMIESLNGL